jgi:hypothetical protein
MPGVLVFQYSLVIKQKTEQHYNLTRVDIIGIYFELHMNDWHLVNGDIPSEHSLSTLLLSNVILFFCEALLPLLT